MALRQADDEYGAASTYKLFLVHYSVDYFFL